MNNKKEAIDKSAVINYDGSASARALTAAVTFSYDKVAGTVTFTNSTQYPAGDSAGNVTLNVTDGFGKTVEANIKGAAGSVVLNLADKGLNPVYGLDAIATVVSTKRKQKDGTATEITLKVSGNFVMEY